MKTEITDKQLIKLKKTIQDMIYSELNLIRGESEEWGLGEMDSLDELNSINDITIDRISPHKGLTVYVKIYSNTDRDDFNEIMSELNYRISKWFPIIKIFTDEIIYI